MRVSTLATQIYPKTPVQKSARFRFDSRSHSLCDSGVCENCFLFSLVPRSHFLRHPSPLIVRVMGAAGAAAATLKTVRCAASILLAQAQLRTSTSCTRRVLRSSLRATYLQRRPNGGKKCGNAGTKSSKGLGLRRMITCGNPGNMWQCWYKLNVRALGPKRMITRGNPGTE